MARSLAQASDPTLLSLAPTPRRHWGFTRRNAYHMIR
eukprot:CAMPEP_0206472700 /NCGR_PEP_ID=MMETSP0324_2-20121206/32377_1 /ASSEMBLY_ACC=CAM_ASM_000836 /TAXON_ID=2866 /ORGANISM="Crypthecodinium cohnii, Strain Seligo" /LENGTH=36 /DNA_ID= /DNA_START= /DNA_END= /DNA_ORIENTATION=